MTSDLNSSISNALIKSNDIEAYELLKTAHLERGGQYCIAYALLEMMPPFDDYENAVGALTKLYGSAEEKVAAIFVGYIFVNLQPIDNSFVSVLSKHKDCAIANYILALYFDYENEISVARKYINNSISQSVFAKNIVFKLTHYCSDLTTAQRTQLKTELKRLIQIRNFENHGQPKTMSQMIEDYFDELILGSKITSQNWSYIKSKLKL